MNLPEFSAPEGIVSLLLLRANDVESNPGPGGGFSGHPSAAVRISGMDKLVADLQRELKSISKMLENQGLQILALSRQQHSSVRTY